MAEAPVDPRWPPGNDVDFDDVLERLLELKVLRYPQHTVRDPSDPYIQILSLAAAMGQHAFGRMNFGLLQLSPKNATSRTALIALLEVVNRPLIPIVPGRGPVYAKLKSAPITSTTYMSEGLKISSPGVIDPVFSIDEDVATTTVITFLAFHQDDSAGTTTLIAGAISVDVGDSIIFAFDILAFDALDVIFTTPIAGDTSLWSLEFRNFQAGDVDSVTDLGSTLEFNLNDYLNIAGVTNVPVGLSINIEYIPSGVGEDVVVADSGGSAIAVTSFLGQIGAPSTSASDYRVTTDWRPVPNSVDDTLSMSANGVITWLITNVLNEDELWEHTASNRFAVRMRLVGAGSEAFPAALEFTSVLNTTGDFWAVGAITQGVRREIAIGQTDGSAFQFIAVPNEPINEPVADPEIALEVAGDTEWLIVDDFSNSDATSKHAVFREDVDDGFGVIFGDGSLGILPTNGSSVKITHRTDSVQSGDTDPTTEIRAIGDPGLVDTWTLFRGTVGYEPAEASTRESVARFRVEVLPQLALRAESAVTPPEIVTALTGGAPFRATFTTSDGRTPFSRALFSTVGAGDRQYRVIVVGLESSTIGAVNTNDLTEAEEWLNGVVVGTEVVGGHGPINTEAIVSKFISRLMVPTVTITIQNPEGVREQADQIITEFFKPHARDENNQFRWDYGGLVPIAILYSLLWNGIPNRENIVLSVFDGSSTFGPGDNVQLNDFELPVLFSTYDPLVNIVLQEP